MMRGMVEAGEVDALVPERVWQECVRALAETTPSVFFSVLREAGACARLFPELDRLFGVPQPPVHHPEIDTGVHTCLALDLAAREDMDTEVRFAVLCHDFGKGLTPPDEWPRHIAHEQRGVAAVVALSDRYRVPRRFRDLAVLVTRYHTLCHQAARLRPSTLLGLLESVDALRRPGRLAAFLDACQADARGRAGLETRAYPQAGIVRAALTAARRVDVSSLRREGLEGEALATRIRQARIAEIAAEVRRRSGPYPRRR